MEVELRSPELSMEELLNQINSLQYELKQKELVIEQLMEKLAYSQSVNHSHQSITNQQGHYSRHVSGRQSHHTHRSHSSHHHNHPHLDQDDDQYGADSQMKNGGYQEEQDPKSNRRGKSGNISNHNSRNKVIYSSNSPNIHQQNLSKQQPRQQSHENSGQYSLAYEHNDVSINRWAFQTHEFIEEDKTNQSRRKEKTSMPAEAHSQSKKDRLKYESSSKPQEQKQSHESQSNQVLLVYYQSEMSWLLSFVRTFLSFIDQASSLNQERFMDRDWPLKVKVKAAWRYWKWIWTQKGIAKMLANSQLPISS